MQLAKWAALALVPSALGDLPTTTLATVMPPGGKIGTDVEITINGSELEEANTDPDINAWLDSRGYENADKCAWTFGHSQFQTSNGSWANMTFGGHNWLIQRNILKSGNSFFCMVDSTHD